MILIIGAGDVGSNLVADLTETHEITVVDRDANRIDTLTDQHDVAGVVGDGRSVSVLQEANIDQAEIVVASTDRDATNVMVCNAAKRSGDPYTIARVKEVGLFQTWQSLNGDLGVDTMLCLEKLTAEAVVRTVALPGAKAVVTFIDGKVEVAEFEIGEDTPVTDRTVAEADQYASATFAAIVRDGDIVIPSGDTVIHAGDRVVVIGSLSSVSRFADSVASEPALGVEDDILIAGGSVLGYQIAQQFEARGWTPKIAERDPEQASRLTTQLSGSTVAELDVTNIGGFNPDVLSGADLFVGAADDDTNYLLAELARERGVSRTAVVVDDPTVVELFEGAEFDVVVHPEDIIEGEIFQAIYESEDISVLEHDSAEVLEIVVNSDSVLAGTSLRDAAYHLPDGVVIGAIVREGHLKIPRGNRIIQTDDQLIVFVDADVASEAVELI